MYGRNRPSMEGYVSNLTTDWNPPAPETGLEESMWELGLGAGDSSSYPERPGESDCIYYLRTGFCRYGDRCRFNHPRDRGKAAGAVRGGGEEYPERVGQPVCQYFMKTGSCKFGATCKYHHPRYGGGATSPVLLNYHGYPLRPGEKECSYYVKTGHCKFGVTCKFHHPQPAGISMPAPVPTFYPPVQPSLVPSPSVAGWQVARPSLLPGSYVQGPYGPVLLSPGVLQIPAWSPYPPSISQVPSPGTQHAVGTGSPYGLTHQLSPSPLVYMGTSSLSSSAGPSSSSQKEHIFPGRPGQPECRFYMRTGDCKYGSACRYHHPPEWSTPNTSCALSPMGGLPLRPGAPPCNFYAQHGVCKFGPMCKFDHPTGTLSNSPSGSSLADMPVAPYPVGSSMGTLAPSMSSSELRPEFVAGSNSVSFSTRIPSSENMSSGSVGSMFSNGASVPLAHTGWSSAPSSSSSSTGYVSENPN